MHTILFYNVENLFDTFNDPSNIGDDEFTPEGEKEWTQDKYKHKLSQLAEAICLADGVPPAFIGLAEIENRLVLEELIQTGKLAEVNYKIVHFSSQDRRGMDCGFIYDSSLFQCNLETKHILTLDDEPEFTTRDILEINGTLNNGAEITFFVNHWPSRREGTNETAYRRIAAAKLLKSRVDELLTANSKANIVVMGDFNDTPEDESIRHYLRALGQHELKKGDLINLLLSEQKDKEGTMVFKREWDVFDQLIVSQGLMNGLSGIEIYENEAQILKKDQLLFTYDNGGQKPAASFGGDQYYGGYSDHLPVFMRIILE